MKTKSSYILLPADFYDEKDSTYPNLLFPKQRLSLGALTREMKATTQSLGLTLQNNGQGFIGDINWNQAMQLIKPLNPLNSPFYFNKALFLMYKGIQYPNFKVFDNVGNIVSSEELGSIFDNITKQEDPYRAEWLHAEFPTKKQITHPKIQSDGTIKIVTEGLGEDNLGSNEKVEITLEYWLKNSTSQGLPRKGTKKGSLYYWSPGYNTVARFNADSDRVDLDCYSVRGGSDPGLGLRPILTAEGPAKNLLTLDQRLDLLNSAGITSTEELKKAISLYKAANTIFKA